MPIHQMRATMGRTIEPTSTLLSRGNLQRSSATQPAPIRRSDSSRIETWRDEVNGCFPPSSASSSSSNPPPEPRLKEGEKDHMGKLERVKSKVFKRRSTNASDSLWSAREGDVLRTSMYDGDRPGERMMEEWEEGAGESMYFGSIGESQGGRLNRAEQLLSGGCGEGEKKVKEACGVQQATA